MRWLLSIGVVALASFSAQAASITDLFNTGVDGSGTPLPDSTVGDPHYTITASDDGDPLGAVQVRTSAGGFPIGPWLSDDSVSAWITPHTDHSGNAGTGTDTYHTTFTLPVGFTSASISGGWATDNEGSNILINGVPTGATASGFGSFTPFTISSGFVPGVNTLDFLVHNDGGPAGLRVEMSGSYTAAAVPEPTSLALLGLGVAGFMAARRRS